MTLCNKAPKFPNQQTDERNINLTKCGRKECFALDFRTKRLEEESNYMYHADFLENVWLEVEKENIFKFIARSAPSFYTNL